MGNHIPECLRTLMENQIPESLRTSIYGKSPLLKKLASLICQICDLTYDSLVGVFWTAPVHNLRPLCKSIWISISSRGGFAFDLSLSVFIPFITLQLIPFKKACTNLAFIWQRWRSKQHHMRKPEKKSASLLVMDLLVHRMSAKQITLAKRGKDKMR